MYKTASIALLIAIAALASAQSSSSFHPVDALSGISVLSLGSGSYKVSLDSNPANIFATVGGQDYAISNLFGFYALGSSAFTSIGGSDQNSWSYKTFSGNDGGGWSGNPAQTAIQPGQNLTFTFSSLSPTPANFGFHVSFTSDTPNWGGSGQTYYIYGPQAVPEPSSLAFLAGAPLALVLKRVRRKRS